ncbi:IS1634 family transposase [Ferruginibacter sp.]|uniref:IS1634 family transposase n=1 Tax=Ferruginibacter sp. TaxID=1940288 RepID=UPI00265B220C|nr:IS1634 family transposase [Ferruginibacter sp.]
MFLKVIYKTIKTTGERKMHYRLCESYRINDTVRHQTILHLGTLEELPETDQKKALALRIDELVKLSYTGKQSLFGSSDAVIEALAQKSFSIIREKQRLDIAAGKDFHRVDTDSIENKDIKETGTEWLCMQALDQLGISGFLAHKKWSSEKIQLALTHIISRAAHPASELRTSQWIKENSAVCELTGYPVEKITKDKLYDISLSLYEVKDELEKHLSKRTNELFDLDDKIILYDLTNTYFEGAVRSSKIAKFGRSKEKRTDARLVVLAVVVNTEGFLKYSQIFEGNIADCSTLEKIIDELSERTSSAERQPTVVLDAGIATEDNLALLKEKKFNYMCVSRSGMKQYIVDSTSQPIKIWDKKGQPLVLQKVTVAGSTDNWLRVHSEAKALKESGMNSRFSQRFEEGLLQIKESITKKNGVKKEHKVWERIGRLKAKYASMHKYYEIVSEADKKGVVTSLTWKQKPVEKNEGYYLLRTTLDQKEEKTQWTIYNTIREIEATFRTLKTDLDLRPIYHKTDKASMAHLHLGLLAYWVVNTIRHQLKQKDINNEWSDIVRIMNTQKIVTTTMDNDYEQQIVIRQCSEPTEQVSKIYTALKYKPKPFTRRKSVVPPPEGKKTERPATPELFSD